MNTKKTHKNKIGVYLLPSAITTIGLFAGFYSIISSINNNFEIAAILIILAMFFDFLDGKVARLTDTQSDFGAQYDSMADLLSFGAAPAVLIYKCGIYELSAAYLFLLFIYIACTALRLSRFNAQAKLIDMSYFQGLPSPASAVFIACVIYLFSSTTLFSQQIENNIIIICALICSFLMVSNFRYNNFKNINVREKISFKLILPIFLMFAFFAYKPIWFIFVLMSLYLLSGVFITIIGVEKIKKIYKKQKKYL